MTKRGVLRGLARAALVIVIVSAIAAALYLLRQIPLVDRADVVYYEGPFRRRVFNPFTFAAMTLITIAGGYVWYRFFPEDFAVVRRRKPVSPRANSGRRWTAEEDARLLELHRDGQSNQKIGIALDRTTGAVRNRLKALTARPADEPPAADPAG